MANQILSQVQEYYGKTLQKTSDLKTNACTTDSRQPPHLRKALSDIHDEVATRYYGCGLVSPQLLEGTRILDLGSGSGRDCFVLSRLAGPRGFVTGVEMTEEQLAVARKYVDYHTQRYGYERPNVEFKRGYIEQLDSLGLAENSVDVIVSNCVVNLSSDKQAVLDQAHRLLKTGGEMYFCDVYADRRIPRQLVEDPILYGECLSGALYWNDFLSLAREAGFGDPRLVEDHPIAINNPEIEERVGHIRFFSATYRLFKLPGLEPACEDYGQAAIYKGTIPFSEQVFVLDKHHRMDRGRVFPVCGNTYRMLSETRFSPHFDLIGDGKFHYGIFEGCGAGLPFETESAVRSASCC